MSTTTSFATTAAIPRPADIGARRARVSLTSQLLYLNGVAVLFAAIYHASGWGYTAMFWWTDRYGALPTPDFSQLHTAQYYVLRMIEQFVSSGVPIFLFVSGYFVAFATRQNQKTISPKVVRARISMLVVPYFTWSILLLSIRLAEGNAPAPLTAVKMLVLGGFASPYYYIPLLCQLYLLAIIMVPLARKHPLFLLSGALLLQLIVLAVQYAELLRIHTTGLKYFAAFTPSWFFPGRVFWFALGVSIGFHLHAVSARLVRYRWLALICALATMLLAALEWEVLLAASGQSWLTPQVTFFDNVYAFLFILAFVGFAGLSLPANGAVRELGAKSFGIYLMHAPVQEFAARLLYHLLPAVLAYQILFQPALVIVSLALPLLIIAVVRRSAIAQFQQYLIG
jgi:fucose 4-O-acetylase-like acetyltransferase